MKIKIHTYPDGPAIGLPHDEIVSAMGLRGRFSDARIGQLEAGDRYIMPIQTELEPRSDTQLLALMAQKHLRALYVNNIIDPKLIMLGMNAQTLMLFVTHLISSSIKRKYESFLQLQEPIGASIRGEGGDSCTSS